MNRTSNILIILCLLLVIPTISNAQYKLDIDLTPNEQVLYDNSFESFENKDFIQSHQGFSQLLSLYPREAAFNFYYGASMIKTYDNPKKGIDYLSFAAGKGIIEANFYIGLAYHHLYNFSNAILFYKKYKNLAKTKDLENAEVDRHIEMANNGKDLIKYAYELQVISNKKISRNNFHYSYDLNNFGGKLIIKTKQFKGKADKKIKGLDLMYISEINKVIFLSSYGDSRKNSLDLYISHQTTSGWSEPQKMPDIINTMYDEAFPFLSEDGNTLYFSSKGHTSMGGYDIFKSNYNHKNNTWSKPENLDFPINTPFDDIMFALDRYNESAFFASTRQSKTGQINVYRILMEKNPMTREIASMEDIYQHASLTSSSVAMDELMYRQEIRAEAMIDSTNTDIVIATNNDTALDADVLINNSLALLEIKTETTNEFLEYSAAAYKLSETRLNEIKALNKDIKSLKNKNDTKSLQIKDSLNRLIDIKSSEASELYDLTKFFNTSATKTNSLIKYYTNELTVLDNISRNENSLIERINSLHLDIQTIETGLPYESYLSTINTEINEQTAKLATYQIRDNENLEKLDALNKKIELKLNLAKNEPDFTIREKYVNDVKTYENEKIDLIAKIKEDKIQIDFISHDIDVLHSRTEIVNNYKPILDENLSSNPNLDIAKIENEIFLLKTHLSQGSLEDLAIIQDKILSDPQYYSTKIDFDNILYSDDIANEQNDRIFIDTEMYADKYDNILSQNTIKTGILLTKNDSLQDIVKDLEYIFDTSTNTYEKEVLITEINKVQSEINSNDKEITNALSNTYPTNTKASIIELENIKANTTTSSALSEKIQIADNLIIESNKIAMEISDLGLITNNESNLSIKYLESIKSELDHEIIKNIESLHILAVEINANSKTDDEILAELNNRINSLETNSNDIEFNEIKDNLTTAQKLFNNADKQNNTDKKNELITEANTLLAITVPKNIDYLNKQLITDYKIYSTYSEVFNDYNFASEKTTEYFEIIESLFDDASQLQMEAEDSEDNVEKMEKLALAYDKMQLANNYYSYVFEIVENEDNYKPELIISNNKNTEDFIAISTNIETIETVDSEPVTITNIELTKVENIIIESRQIQNDIAKLEQRYKDAPQNEQIEIIAEIERLNDNLNQKLFDANRHIILAQKDIIQENIDLLKEDTPKSERNDIEDLFNKYNNKVDDAIQSNDFYFLGEVIIEGENLLNKQNQYLENITTYTQLDNDLNNLISSSQHNEDFINRTIASNTNNNATQNSTDINSIIDKLNNSNYQTDLENIHTDQTDKSIDLASIESEISALKTELENANRKSTQDRLKLELNSLENDNINKLIGYSESKSKYISELDKIYKAGKSDLDNTTDSTYANLLAEQAVLRKSIIEYNNFYTLEELQAKNIEALSIENKIIEYQLEYIAELNIKNLDNNLADNSSQTTDNNTNNNTNNTIVNDYVLDSNYNFDYDYDNKTNTQISRLETKINKNNINIAETENTIAKLETGLAKSNAIEEYQRMKDELEKANQTYLKQIKNWAELNKDYLSLTSTYANEFYNDNINTSARITTVSDSLKRLSGYDIEKSLALFERISTYNAKIADSELINTYRNAKTLSGTGLSRLNAANDVKTISPGNEDRNPIVLAYYRSTETNIITETDTTDIAITENTDLITVNNDSIPTTNIITETDTTDIAVTENTDLITVNNDSIPTTNIITETDTTDIAITENTDLITANNNDTDIASVLKTENNLIGATANSQYSDENPIPSLDIKDELCYRIQIGAFFKPVDNESFAGISPIFMEHVIGSQLLRYIVGTFYTFNSAKNSLPTVRGLGYADAFIVAYYNGKRISIYEARKIEEQIMQDIRNGVLTINNNTNNDNNDNNNLIENTETNNTTDNNEAEVITELTETSNVFYCVQIGVYGTRLGSERLYNLDPIMYHNYANNLVRHTFGKYYDINAAINEQNKIRRLGIKDAFVIAYSDGERITLNEAKALINAQTEVPTDEIRLNIPDNIIAANEPVVVEVPVVPNNNEPNIIEDDNNGNNDDENEVQVVVEYYIQIGVFRRDVNVYVRNQFNQIAGNNQLIRQTQNNLTLYRIGVFSDYSSAQAVLNNTKNSGITDAFIVAFADGKRINITKARELE